MVAFGRNNGNDVFSETVKTARRSRSRSDAIRTGYLIDLCAPEFAEVMNKTDLTGQIAMSRKAFAKAVNVPGHPEEDYPAGRLWRARLASTINALVDCIIKNPICTCIEYRVRMLVLRHGSLQEDYDTSVDLLAVCNADGPGKSAITIMLKEDVDRAFS